ncbi:MAG: hypothetical protein K0R40_1186 [Burkholderiales bacterium]|nr:hypothetical protein [Burkholderiales bacterium]
MRKIFNYAIAGLAAVYFSQIALAQSVGVNPSAGDTGASPPSSSGQGQPSGSHSSGGSYPGASGDKDNDKRRGKGQAKGWDRGKGHVKHDKRYGGRHNDASARNEKKY